MMKIKVLKKSMLACRGPNSEMVVCMQGTVAYTDRNRAIYLAAIGDIELVDEDEPEPEPTPEPTPVADTSDAGEGIDLV